MVAVVPVLVGPLQTLLALLPALLVAAGTLLMALFTPRGLKQVARFLWRQKLFSTLVLAMGCSLYTGIPFRYLWGGSRTGQAALGDLRGEWPAFRGGPLRTGALLDGGADQAASRGMTGPQADEPASGRVNWTWTGEPTVYSSPAVVGDQVIVTTAGGIGPFSPAGRGAIVSLDAETGRERWRYAPDDFRATFSSPVAAEGRVVSGEGLHLVQDARVTCLDLNGQRQWEFRTKSHVESTPSVANGRVYVGAGDDGFYCLALHDPVAGVPRVVWHLPGAEYPDCESSPLVVGDTVYFGLGEGGHAICAVDAQSGKPKWRVETPYPVFAPPSLVPTSPTELGKTRLIVAMGNGNFVQSAEDLLEARLATLREANASADEIDEARRRHGPAGAVWILDPETGDKTGELVFPQTVLGAVAWANDRLVCSTRDGHVHAFSPSGKILATRDAREPIVTSPCVGATRLFVVTVTGRLHALDIESFEPAWDTSLGAGTTYLSSPVLAHGRLYVGTSDQGVVCVGGKRKPDPICWSHGDAGGLADHGRLPESAAERVTVGMTDAPPRKVWTPIPTPEGLLTACGVDRETVVSLIRFPNADERDATVVWRHSHPMLALSPLLVGDKCLLVCTPPLDRSTRSGPTGSVLTGNGLMFEPSSLQHSLQQPAIVLCLAARTGEVLWKQSVAIDVFQTATLDSSRLYLADRKNLTCLSLDDGKVEYAEPLGISRARFIDASNDCVVVGGERGWQAFDGPTGRTLSLETFPEDDRHVASFDMRLAGDRLIIAGEQSIEARRFTDNTLLWRADVVSTGPLVLHHGRVARSLVDGAAGVWQIDDGAEVLRVEGNEAPVPPLLDARHVYVRKGDKLEAWSLSDGSSVEWASLTTTRGSAAPLVAAGDRVFLSTDDGRVTCLEGRHE